MTFSYHHLKAKWDLVLNLGIKENLSPLEIRQIQTINGLCIIGSITLIILFFVNIVYVGYMAAVVDIIGIFGVIIPTWRLNYKGHYLMARVLAFYACIIISALMATYNILNDRPLFTEINIIAMAPAAILFFEGRLKNYSFIFAVACYLGVLFLRYTFYIGPNKSIYFFNLDLAIFYVSICYGLANIHKNAYNATQKIIINQNEELKIRKKEVEDQAIRLAELNAMKDKFFGIISHDLRSPFNSFHAATEMLRKQWLSKSEFDDCINSVSNDVRQTKEFLDNLLHWAKSQIDGGEIIKPTIVDVNGIIADVIQLLSREASNKNIEIISESGNHLNAWGDAENISMVLRNLTNNAIKFSNNGDKIVIDAHEEGDFISISVEDYGVGIPIDSLKGIFSGGVKSTKGTQNEKGTGLGLMLCREFVERNGGHISADSTQNEGSIFSFTIPKYRVTYN